MTGHCPHCNRTFDLTNRISGDEILCVCNHRIRVQFQPRATASLTDVTPRRPMGQVKPPTDPPTE